MCKWTRSIRQLLIFFFFLIQWIWNKWPLIYIALPKNGRVFSMFVFRHSVIYYIYLKKLRGLCYSTGTVTVTIYPARDRRVESQVTHPVVTCDLCDYLNFDSVFLCFFQNQEMMLGCVQLVLPIDKIKKLAKDKLKVCWSCSLIKVKAHWMQF